jgi:5-methylcytosine-specific restriction endonuclease McrA
MPYRDREQRLAYHRGYRQRNAARLREQDRLYRLTHKEQIASGWRKWHASHPAATDVAVKKARQNWQAANPDKVRAKVALRRARQNACFVESVSPALVYERDGGRCQSCGLPVDPHSFHIDHIVPISRGGEHSYANVQLAHASCNHRKGAR